MKLNPLIDQQQNFGKTASHSSICVIRITVVIAEIIIKSVMKI